MSTAFIIPRSDNKRNIWLSKFAYKLAQFAETLEIDAQTLDYVNKAAKHFDYLLTLIRLTKEYQKEWTAYRNEVMFGKAGKIVSKLPYPVDLGPPPTTPDAPIQHRINKLIQIIKNHPNYTEYIGRDLEIIAS